MADETFKPGNTVRLKSGGPLMTVAFFEPQTHPPSVHVVWFDHENKKHEANFVPDTLINDNGSFSDQAP
jgi:uncharacterized protein YodC (DUF2158 family)